MKCVKGSWKIHLSKMDSRSIQDLFWCQIKNVPYRLSSIIYKFFSENQLFTRWTEGVGSLSFQNEYEMGVSTERESKCIWNSHNTSQRETRKKCCVVLRQVSLLTNWVLILKSSERFVYSRTSRDLTLSSSKVIGAVDLRGDQIRSGNRILSGVRWLVVCSAKTIKMSDIR